MRNDATDVRKTCDKGLSQASQPSQGRERPRALENKGDSQIVALSQPIGVRHATTDGHDATAPATSVRQSLKELARAVSDRQPAEQARNALHEALEGLTAYREALILGRLMVCGNCAAFTFGSAPADVGHCANFTVEAWAFVPFWCSRFKPSRTPAAAQYLPDGARARDHAK
jgi:hypothetical protein